MSEKHGKQVIRDVTVYAFAHVDGYIQLTLRCPECGQRCDPASDEPEESVRLLVWVVTHECGA